jgi:hypothetical protein
VSVRDVDVEGDGVDDRVRRVARRVALSGLPEGFEWRYDLSVPSLYVVHVASNTVMFSSDTGFD